MGFPSFVIVSSKPVRNERIKEHVETLLLSSCHGARFRQPQDWPLNAAGAICRQARLIANGSGSMPLL
jgi:hypothetical protein